MAEVIYQDPVQEIRGTLTKDGTIHRRKYYRDANGKIIGASKPEAPIDPDTGRHKTYFRFDAFIRTCLLREMEAK